MRVDIEFLNRYFVSLITEVHDWILRSSLLSFVRSEFIFELCLSLILLVNFVKVPKTISHSYLSPLRKVTSQENPNFTKHFMRTVFCVWRKPNLVSSWECCLKCSAIFAGLSMTKAFIVMYSLFTSHLEC